MAKAFISALVLVPILALPTIASASSNGPLTREQVRAELVQLHQAGYDRNHGDAHYPTHLQTALESVGDQQQALSGYGGAYSGSAAFGAPTKPGSSGTAAPAQPGWDHSIYKGS
ncbi:DUF4148 domain-containing protein [Paraburkholderia sp. UCT31]|uniref:DUF4148 domain-containing protein n=1 Tax=Paraburkholderia sp. UCT31 TaxID=2615209 RepID=UPI001654F18C|nr:DUF4148 domain-containing protein [Paraburkholderia sp. UCT31]MBC8740602.1 DUF4148 domain-containing protein [Paraburkholderia sp. UCT31]